MSEAHRVGVASQAGKGNFFWLGFGETNDPRGVFDLFQMDFAWTVTGFAALFVTGKTRVADIEGVGGSGESLCLRSVTLDTFFFADEVFGFCLGEEVEGERSRLGFFLAGDENECP